MNFRCNRKSRRVYVLVCPFFYILCVIHRALGLWLSMNVQIGKRLLIALPWEFVLEISLYVVYKLDLLVEHIYWGDRGKASMVFCMRRLCAWVHEELTHCNSSCLSIICEGCEWSQYHLRDTLVILEKLWVIHYLNVSCELQFVRNHL